jgi:RNA polymerase sigma-70 factor (ECF subfamily)
MTQQTLQSGELTLANDTAVSPFEDIEAVHTLYEPRVFRFLLLSVRDRDLAFSLTQDTFLAAWKSRDSFHGDCGIATWLMRIAVNLLRSHTRTETFKFWKRASADALDANDLSAQLPHPSASAESSLIAQQQLAKVWESVEQLSSHQRSIFILRFLDEVELSEIAQIMNMPVPTVKTHLYRALDHIRAKHNPVSPKSSKRGSK